MRADAIVFGIAGTLFGLIIGWILGSQQPSAPIRAAAPVAQSAPASQSTIGSQAAVIDPERVKALETVAAQNPSDPQPRVQLGNLFFDGEKYGQAITWYEQALTLKPNDPNVSTDLGVAYYYTNQSDRALAQFDRSLAIDPRHVKTLLNVGIVRAFGKRDLAGAAKAWEQVVAIAPDTPEGQAARKGLEGLKSAHPDAGKGGS
ncbi:MAG: tetratricopeptide repeat protein [Vicinamibacterales bacterium]